MYGWIWRHLPGNTLVKFGCAVLVLAGLIYFLFLYFFPWLDPRLPFNRVTVDETQSRAVAQVAAIGPIGPLA